MEADCARQVRDVLGDDAFQGGSSSKNAVQADYRRPSRFPDRRRRARPSGDEELPPGRRKNFPTKKLELEKTTPTIRVRAVPGKVRITENDTELIEFSPPEDPRGPLGIFVKDRPTFFYRGTITALKE